MYGFAKSHEQRHTNETFLAQVLHWASGLSQPVLLGGDLNETVLSSSVLSFLDQWRFVRLNSDKSTTKGKVHAHAQGLPIDHAIVNMKMRDWACASVMWTTHVVCRITIH